MNESDVLCVFVLVIFFLVLIFVKILLFILYIFVICLIFQEASTQILNELGE